MKISFLIKEDQMHIDINLTPEEMIDLIDKNELTGQHGGKVCRIREVREVSRETL